MVVAEAAAAAGTVEAAVAVVDMAAAVVVAADVIDLEQASSLLFQSARWKRAATC